MTPDVLARLRAAAPQAFSDDVRFAYLFGSHATGRARRHSDVDVAVYLDPAPSPDRALDRSLELASAVERAAGLGPVEVVVLNDAPPRLLGRILRDRKIILSRDEPLRVRFESLASRRFLDFDIHARRLDRALLRRMAEGA